MQITLDNHAAAALLDAIDMWVDNQFDDAAGYADDERDEKFDYIQTLVDVANAIEPGHYPLTARAMYEPEPPTTGATNVDLDM